MSRILLLCFVFFLNQTTSLVAQRSSGVDFTSVKNNIKSQIESNHVPSIAVAVVKDQKILWEESFGYSNRKLKINSTINTPYYVASVTKLMTATAMMKLYEKGQIDLDSSANKYLIHPKISSPFWDASEATIRRLLQHTSGLTTYDKECYPDSENCSFSVDSANNRYGIVFWKPGTYFDYSNVGYAVLGQIISNVSGDSFNAFLQKEIFTPLAMKNSYVNSSSAQEAGAVRYLGDSARTRVPFKISYSPGASTVYSSVHDLALFSIFFLNPEKTIISRNSIADIQNASTEPDTTIQGMRGFRNNNYYGYTLFSSQGGTNDAQAWVQFIPSEKVAVIVLSNTGNTNCISIINDAFSAVLPNFKNKPAPASQTQAKNVKPASMPSLPDGTYQGRIHTANQEVSFSIQFKSDKELIANIGNKKEIVVPKFRWNNNRLHFEIPGNLNIPTEIKEETYNLEASLCFKGNEFYGAVTTSGINNPRTPRLPFWARLIKQ